MGKEKLILLVEDNEDDVALAQRAFQKSDIPHRMVVARDGVEALDYLFATGAWAGRDPEDDPAVVLLDLKLPKIDGLEVLRRLRAYPRTKLLPVVIMTSSVEERDLARGYELGTNSYVHKPVDFLEFVEAARELGVYWLTLNQPPLPPREEYDGAERPAH
ncbi:MAG: response regulator [Deltaproteobacteria bacterium]|nr:response regulator [Deltaproteobacteria bacterium]